MLASMTIALLEIFQFSFISCRAGHYFLVLAKLTFDEFYSIGTTYIADNCVMILHSHATDAKRG